MTEPPPPRTPRGWAWLALAALLVVFGVLAWNGREAGVTTGNDDARYMLLARALRAGTYRDLYRVGQGWHALYPPVFPALLAGWGAVFGESYGRFIVLNILIAAATIVLLFDMARRWWPIGVALALAALLVFNYSTMFNTTSKVMSEAPYAALCVLALWAVATRPGSTAWMWVAAGAACLAALTRSIGVTMLAGLGLAWLVERRWKALGALIGLAAVTVVPWMVWTFVAPAQFLGRSYAADARAGITESGPGPLATLAFRLQSNGAQYATRIIPNSFPVPTIEGTVLDNVFWLGVWLGLTALGLFAIWKRSKAVTLYTLCYLGLLLIWVWSEDRFLAPIVPLLVLAVVAGAWEIGKPLGERRWIPVAALTAVFCASGLWAQTAFLRMRAACDRSVDPPTLGCEPAERASFVEAARWAGASLPAGAGVATGKDASFAYLSGLPVVPAAPLVREPPEYFRQRMKEVGADYLLIGRVHAEDFQLANALLPLCDQVVVVREFAANTYLLRLRDPGDAPTPSTRICAALDSTAAIGRRQ